METTKKARNYKTIQAFGAFIVLVSISFLGVIWYALDGMKTSYLEKIENITDTEWVLLENIWASEMDLAKRESEEIGRNISREIATLSQEEIANLLDNYREPENPIRTAVVTSLEGNYHRDIKADNMDGFSTLGWEVSEDGSSDCVSFGPSRDFIQEASMHANPYQAISMFSDIASGNIENLNISSTSHPLMMEFSDNPFGTTENQDNYIAEGGYIHPDHLGKRSLVLSSYDMAGLEEHFKEGMNWRATFFSYEFVSTTYLFAKEDLAGRPFIENGINIQDRKRLAINTVFNLRTVIENTPRLLRDLSRFQWLRDEALTDMIKTEIRIYIILFLLLIVCTTAMAYTSKNITLERHLGEQLI